MRWTSSSTYCPGTLWWKESRVYACSRTALECCRGHFGSRQILQRQTTERNRIPALGPRTVPRIRRLLWSASSRFCCQWEPGSRGRCFSFSEGTDRAATPPRMTNGRSLSRGRKTSPTLSGRSCQFFRESSERMQGFFDQIFCSYTV